MHFFRNCTFLSSFLVLPFSRRHIVINYAGLLPLSARVPEHVDVIGVLWLLS